MSDTDPYIQTLLEEIGQLKSELEERQRVCALMLPVFEAARPLVLNMIRLQDAADPYTGGPLDEFQTSNPNR